MALPLRCLLPLLLVVALLGLSMGSGACGTPGATGFASTVDSAVMRKGPYLMYEGDNTRMTVLWQTKTAVSQAAIEWGQSPDYGHGPKRVVESSGGTDGHLFRYDITGLGPGSLTYYRVAVEGNSFEGSFRAAPPAAGTSAVL